MEEVIQKGAEAELVRKNSKVLKKRIEKGYRAESLDKKLRAERTELEKRLIEKARNSGVNTPKILNKNKFELEMEFIEGKKVRDILEDNLEICEKIGESIARLHNRNIIHGDLTTSNMIKKNSEIFFIDFGLGYFSQRIEDKAMDLFLLKEILKSTHYKVAEEAFGRILKAYKENYQEGKTVINRLEEIEKRGRYR